MQHCHLCGQPVQRQSAAEIVQLLLNLPPIPDGPDSPPIIVVATLSMPGMILAETALSFLGLGLQPPITSWGVLLNEAQNINVVALYPWLMLPVLPVIVVILAFNFFGDGLRDAADPYK